MNDHSTKKNKRHFRISLKSFSNGDFLLSDFLNRNKLLLLLIFGLVIFYISNRYVCQQQQIQIDMLKKKLIDTRYDAMTRNAELMMKSRQSIIEENIQEIGSKLQIPTEPPYQIHD